MKRLQYKMSREDFQNEVHIGQIIEYKVEDNFYEFTGFSHCTYQGESSCKDCAGKINLRKNKNEMSEPICATMSTHSDGQKVCIKWCHQDYSLPNDLFEI